MSDTTPPTAYERSLERTGPCINQACTFECAGFALAGHKDGFDVCVCTHTRHVHAKPERKVDA